MRRSNRTLSRLLLALGGLALGLVAAEGWAATYLPVRRPVFRLDPELLHEPVPGARRVLLLEAQYGGAPIPMAFDERGYRRPWSSESTPRDPHRPLVAVFGDSLVLAESVPHERTFVVHLAHELARLGTPVDVVNAGVSGYGPDQALLRLEERLDELRPDHVVFVVCAHNDYGDLVRNKLFTVGQAGTASARRSEIDPVLAARWELNASEGRRLAVRRLFDLWRERRQTAAARALEGEKPFIDWYLEGAQREWEDYLSGDPRVRSLLVDYYDADVTLHPAWPSVAGKRALARAVARRLGETCAAARVGLTPVVVPSAVDLDPHFAIQVDRARFPHYDPARLSATWCEDLATLEPIDGFPLLAAAPDPGACFHGDIDFHWNELGQELIARAVAPRVHAALAR